MVEIETPLKLMSITRQSWTSPFGRISFCEAMRGAKRSCWRPSEPVNGLARVDHRHQGKLETRLALRLGTGIEDAVANGAVLQHVANERGEGVSIGDRRRAQEIDAAELAAEMLAQAGAGQAEAEGVEPRALGDEGLAQEARNFRRLDLEPARRNTPIAYAVPIRVKLPAR
jgi:hypothetical protein